MKSIDLNNQITSILWPPISELRKPVYVQIYRNFCWVAWGRSNWLGDLKLNLFYSKTFSDAIQGKHSTWERGR